MSEYVCEECGESMDVADLNVEAFEITGSFLCPFCAEAAFEDASAEPAI